MKGYSDGFDCCRHTWHRAGRSIVVESTFTHI